jgi:indole-3-glycerol phosphate synthase/phosphoribosylanthranilate isomerase
MAEGALREIETAKRVEVERRLAGSSIEALRARAQATTRSLADALSRPGGRFILEIKRSSPSGGAIRPYADPASIARGYAGVADALSVLTDAYFFGGSLRDLAAVRPHFHGPVLAKDFFLDPRQVPEARIAGADAILVMLSLLDDETARGMIEEARRLQMDALVEVHDANEMRRALRLGAMLIGINNRDLRDFSIALSTTERLSGLVPPGCVLVSESGIMSRGDLDRLAGHVDAYLIGSSLMRAADPADAARSLIFGRVKLCGLNRPEDFEPARAAAYAGLVFVPDSPRAISLRQATRLAPLHPRPVGVFRDQAMECVADAAGMLGLAAVQLHGREDSDYVRTLIRRLPSGCEVWKAIDPRRERAATFDAADRLLFDNAGGGTGKAFDWTRVRGHPRLAQSLVAGGIGPRNVAAAHGLGAYAVDIGSATDHHPGRKSPEKIATVFDALRPSGRQRMQQCA